MNPADAPTIVLTATAPVDCETARRRNWDAANVFRTSSEKCLVRESSLEEQLAHCTRPDIVEVSAAPAETSIFVPVVIASSVGIVVGALAALAVSLAL